MHTPDLFEGRTFDTVEEGVSHAEQLGFDEVTERGVRAVEGLPAELVYAGFSLGFLLPRLYQIYANPALYSEAFHDITTGNNSFGGIAGYSAGTGWDAASGLGTPDAAGLADALSHTTPAP